MTECSGWRCFRDEEDDYWKGLPVDDQDRPDDALGLPPEELRDWPVPMPYLAPRKVGRNDPCPCGSGKKYKKCCGKN